MVRTTITIVVEHNGHTDLCCAVDKVAEAITYGFVSGEYTDGNDSEVTFKLMEDEA